MSKKKQSDPAEAEQKAPETPSEDETAKAAAQEEFPLSPLGGLIPQLPKAQPA